MIRVQSKHSEAGLSPCGVNSGLRTDTPSLPSRHFLPGSCVSLRLDSGQCLLPSGRALPSYKWRPWRRGRLPGLLHCTMVGCCSVLLHCGRTEWLFLLRIPADSVWWGAHPSLAHSKLIGTCRDHTRERKEHERQYAGPSHPPQATAITGSRTELEPMVAWLWFLGTDRPFPKE